MTAIPKNSTDRDMLRLLTTQQLRKAARLGVSGSLTPSERYSQARFAQRMRNFWFTLTGNPIKTSLTTGANSLSTGTTPTFADPIIVTDLLAMQDYKFDSGGDLTLAPNVSRFLLQILRNSGAAYGEDFFGLVGPIGQEFITKHMKDNSTGILVPGAAGSFRVVDTQSKWLGLVPRLLAPFETLRANWAKNINNTFVDDAGVDAFSPQLGFRAVKALLEDNPYAYFSERLDGDIKRYIADATPETFFLELTFPFAKLPAVNGMMVIETDQQQRPLLVLGACSNLQGFQGRLEDRSKSYNFTLIDPMQNVGTTATAPPLYKDVPLNLWAPNSDFRPNDLYNMWPIPHLLEPGATLRVTLTNGLLPDTRQVAQQGGSTRNDQPPRITFLCRTV